MWIREIKFLACGHRQFLATTVIFIVHVTSLQAADPLAAARQNLVDRQIRTAGVTNERVLRSILETPRHEFIPRKWRNQAYLDMALPIGDSQTISSPFIVALMTEALDTKSTDKVLEIGTGSGYQAAILSPLVKHVYTIEIVESLGDQARKTLKRLKYNNVSVRIGDGFLGWSQFAPFDKIIVTCSPESIPKPLVDQLREGGRMVIPVGERYQQTLYLLEKQDGQMVQHPLRPTLFVPMTGEAEGSRQQKPDPDNPGLINGDFHEIGKSSEFVPGWYYGRQVHQITNDTTSAKALACFVRFENHTPGLDSHLLQGLAINGRKIRMIRLAGKIRLQNVQGNRRADTLPKIAVSFYDKQRRSLGTFGLGPYQGTHPWREESQLIRVPPKTREAIVRIGLFGATGQADFDEISIRAM